MRMERIRGQAVSTAHRLKRAGARALFCFWPASWASGPRWRHCGSQSLQQPAQFQVRVAPRIYIPTAVTNLAGIAGGEGQVLLQWASPEESAGVSPKGGPPVQYQIRAATCSVADLGGDTTAWFNLA